MQHVIDTLPKAHVTDVADAIVRHVSEALRVPDKLMQPGVQRRRADTDNR